MIPYDQDPTPTPHEYRIYADDMAQSWAVVDQIDYQWAIQWKWHINKPHPNRKGSKRYFCRSNGSGGRRRGPRLFLHVEIMKRTGVQPPDQYHNLVGHLDDDEWNCREANLTWETSQSNRTSLNNKQKRADDDRKSSKNVRKIRPH